MAAGRSLPRSSPVMPSVSESGDASDDSEVGASWSVVMSMCHRTASGGSEPQIGSSRDAAGSCLGAVSRNGHSRDWSTVGVSPSCADPGTASRPLLSPAGDASAMLALSVVPAGGDADLTDLPCSRSPAPSLSPGRRRRSPSAARSLLRNPPGRASCACGASSGRRVMAPASLHNNLEAARVMLVDHARQPGQRLKTQACPRAVRWPDRHSDHSMPKAKTALVDDRALPLLVSSIPQQPTTPP